MRHPTEGVLRRLLDEPPAITDADREHVAGCEACGGRLAAIRDDADLAHAALTGVGADVDVAAAWQRLSIAASDPRPVPPPAPRRAGRFRAALRRPAVAAIAFAVVLTGAGVAAAIDWLQIFRTEQIAPISLSAADLNALPDLREYGDIVV